MVNMLFGSLAIDNDVVQVYNARFSAESCQNDVESTLKDGGAFINPNTSFCTDKCRNSM